MKSIVIAACMGVISHTTWADANWKCTNAVLLDLCRNASCWQNRSNSLDERTLHINLKNNRSLTICTKNSCWRGEVQPSLNSDSKILQLRDVDWKDPNPRNHQHYVLSINPDAKTLFFESNKGKHPLQCAVA